MAETKKTEETAKVAGSEEEVKKEAVAKNPKTPELSEAAAKNYKLKGIAPGKYHFKGFGEIDLTAISAEKADQLFKAKFPYLEKK